MAEVKIILEKLYPPCTMPISSENLAIFLRFAEQYDVEEIRRQCEQFIIGSEPSLEMALLAEQYRLTTGVGSFSLACHA